MRSLHKMVLIVYEFPAYLNMETDVTVFTITWRHCTVTITWCHCTVTITWRHCTVTINWRHSTVTITCHTANRSLKNIQNKTNNENTKQNKVCFQTGCKTKTKTEIIKRCHIRNSQPPNHNSFSIYLLPSAVIYTIYIDILTLCPSIISSQSYIAVQTGTDVFS